MLALGRMLLKALKFLPARQRIPVGFGHRGSDMGDEAAMFLVGRTKYGEGY